jgi:hypothetical protein
MQRQLELTTHQTRKQQLNQAIAELESTHQADGYVALRYHEATKHHFGRFARALGYLDWATQPDPFRRFEGAERIELPRAPLASDVLYASLYDGTAPRRAVDPHSIGEFLRCSMGLSAWKQYGASRWALRVNPSSGNLHPTETYIVFSGQCSSLRAARACARMAGVKAPRRFRTIFRCGPPFTPRH